jgi:hypothetical protein
MKKLYSLFSLITIVLTTHAQLFKQDFQSSTSLSAYSSLNPDNGQFNEIFDADAGNNMLISINDFGGANTLRFNKSGNTVGAFTRTKDFSPAPGVIVWGFDLTLSGNISTSTSTVATWYLGNNFTTGGTAPLISGAGNQTYSYFQLDYLGSGNPNKARFKSSSGTLSGSFNTGEKQTVFFIANNSGATINYLAPNGTTTTVGNDKYDLWLGPNIAFNEIDATGPAEQITDMKFVFNQGVGILDFDNLVVDEYSSLAAPFYQNFSSSSLLLDYVSSNPYFGQFKEIYDGKTNGANADNMIININSSVDNSLRFIKSVTGSGPANANVGSFLRSTDLNGTPTTLMFEFDLNAGGALPNLGNRAAKIYAGGNIAGGANSPNAEAIHSFFEIDLDEEGLTDRIRFRKGGTADALLNANNSSVWFNLQSTPYRMLFVVNNATVTKEYYSPAGTIESLAPDQYNLWVGTTKAFATNGTATNINSPLQNVKFLFNDHTGTIEFDNMLINAIPEPNTTVPTEIINNSGDPQFLAKWTASTPEIAVSGYRLDVATTPFSAGTTSFVPGFQNLYVEGSQTLQQLVTQVSTTNDHYIRVRPVYQIGENEVSGTFSNVTLLTAAVFLPVTLTSFTGTLVNGNGELKWITEEEINSAYYEVERSVDGQVFAAIGKVISANSATGYTYQYSDRSIASGKNYYRLKMVDIDGKFEYSHVIILNGSTGSVPYSVYPNPASGRVMVQYQPATQGAILRIVDMQGQLLKIYSLNTGSTQLQLNLSGMKPGTYNLVINNGGEQKILRIQKQ